MEIKIQEYKDIAVIAIKGRLDHSTVPQMDQAFETATDRGKYKLIIDLSQLNFLSSSGIDALLTTQKNIRSRNRGEMVLVGLHPRVRGTLELAGLAGFFKYFDDLPSAMEFASSLPGTSTTEAPPPSEKDKPKSI